MRGGGPAGALGGGAGLMPPPPPPLPSPPLPVGIACMVSPLPPVVAVVVCTWVKVMVY